MARAEALRPEGFRSVDTKFRPGNKFVFNDANKWLNPTFFEFAQPISNLNFKVSDLFMESYTGSPWAPQILLTSESQSYFALVFEDKYVTSISKDYPDIDRFIISDQIKPSHQHEPGEVELKVDDLNDWLLESGTNFQAKHASAGFNGYRNFERGKLPFSKPKEVTVYQEGVAYLYVDLITIDREIKNLENGIREQADVFREHAIPLNERRKELARFRTDRPRPLFPPVPK
jgi:hypothetical protein